MVFRGFLLSCLDFDYLFYSTIIAGICYIPAILVVTLYPAAFQEQAISYNIASNIPQTVPIVLLLPRILYNFHRMKNGIEGPWSNPVKGEAANGEEDKSAPAAAAAVIEKDEDDDNVYEDKSGAFHRHHHHHLRRHQSNPRIIAATTEGIFLPIYVHIAYVHSSHETKCILFYILKKY
jgi:hypothetical protein